LPNLGDVLLSDTVGFIRDLPHHLVASFKSTLEEARHADLLLHVIDVSQPDAERQIKAVNDVLEDIGVDRTNLLLVLNKTDAVTDRSMVDVLRVRFENAISVSAQTGAGLDRLKTAIAQRLAGGYVDAQIETDIGNGRLMAYLAGHAEVTSTEYGESRVTLNCRIPRVFVGKLADDDTSVRIQDAVDEVGNNGFLPLGALEKNTPTTPK
jgi:GTP-binding protein HflX